jgi:lysozyme
MPWDRVTAPAPGVLLIKTMEGLRLHPYNDGFGYMTIGYGTRIGSDNRPVTAATANITEAEANTLLLRDLERFMRIVVATFEVEMDAHQAGALLSFAYNLGSFAKAPSLKRLVNARRWPEAARQFGAYANSAGRASRGLRRRRWAEAAVFLGNVDPIWAWAEAQHLIMTVDDWPPIPVVGNLSVPRSAGLPGSTDHLNEAQLELIRRNRQT